MFADDQPLPVHCCRPVVTLGEQWHTVPMVILCAYSTHGEQPYNSPTEHTPNNVCVG